MPAQVNHKVGQTDRTTGPGHFWDAFLILDASFESLETWFVGQDEI